MVMLDGDPVVVVALPGGEIRAFGARCTHLGCIIQYNARSEHLECPCHGGRFAADGRVIAGPPPAPLREYAVQIRAGEVVVVRG
jgi:cytochrome b6-f complex iron-sulfur subunit